MFKFEECFLATNNCTLPFFFTQKLHLVTASQLLLALTCLIIINLNISKMFRQNEAHLKKNNGYKTKKNLIYDSNSNENVMMAAF
jgi:hypothetical protein